MSQRAGLNREKVLQSASELCDQHGLHNLSMSTLAAQLGVRTPTLYYHIDSLAALRRALAMHALDLIGEQLGRAIMGKSGQEAVHALAYALRDFAHARPGLYQAAQSAPAADDHEWQAAGRTVVDTMRCAFASYQLDEEQSRQAVRMLRSMLHGCIVLEQLDGFGVAHAAENTFQELLIALELYLTQLSK
jgi:AcrR family transcriptional regulator